MASPDFITLVVGVTADGKSTLLNALMDDVRADEDIDRAEMLDMGSDNAKGTTTETQFFETNQMIGSCNLVLVDTPGFGTQKVSIEQTIASILSQFDGEVKINCIVVTAPATTTNPGLGAQIVRKLVQSGIAGDNDSAWNNVVLVGTKADRADPSEISRFRKAIVNEFFAEAPTSCARRVCFTRACEKDEHGNAKKLDVSELLDVLKQLDTTFWYKKHGLTNDVLEKIFTDLFGIEKEEVQKKLGEVDRLRGVIKDREKKIQKLTPGREQILVEKRRLDSLLRQERLASKSRSEYEARRKFFGGRSAAKAVKEEAIKEGIAGQVDEKGNLPLEQSFKYACPPKGCMNDILWHLYLHRFGGKVAYPETFKVERIVNERIGSDGRHEYLIKWDNYLEAENSWEREENIEDPSLLQDFRALPKQLKRPASASALVVAGSRVGAKEVRRQKGHSKADPTTDAVQKPWYPRKQKAAGAPSTSSAGSPLQKVQGVRSCNRQASAPCGGKGVCCCSNDHPHQGKCKRNVFSPGKQACTMSCQQSPVIELLDSDDEL